MKDRALRAKRGGNPGHRVGAARTSGSDNTTELPGLTRISVGGMRGGLLVAYIDDADTLVETAIVNIDDMSTAERENGIDAFGLEGLGNQVTSGYDRTILGFAFRVSVAVSDNGGFSATVDISIYLVGFVSRFGNTRDQTVVVTLSQLLPALKIR